MSRWDRQFFTSTRGQIVTLLRRTRQTVDDLAARLGLTDNAVRAHLSRLERDGLVQQRGQRRGERRPALVYELTREAEALFPKAYRPALAQLLEVLAQERSPHAVDALLRQTGRRLAEGQARQTGTPSERLESAAGVLGALGGLAEVETDAQGGLALRSFSCPLGELVPAHPEVCRLAEALVGEVSGLDIREVCERGDPGEPPRCRFEVVGRVDSR